MADNANDTIEREFETLSGKLKVAITDIGKKHDAITTEMKNFGDATAETKAAADKALTDLNAIVARVSEIEQKMARRPGPGVPETIKSAGEMFVESENVKAFLATSSKRTMSGPISVQMERKNITSAASTIGSTQMPNMSLVVPERQELLALPRRPTPIRGLIQPGRTSANAVYYPVQLTRSLNAAVVAEGALKPQSEITFDNQIFPVQTLAHIFKASRQIMDDAPGLQSFIDAEARFGLELIEDTEFLYGDGTGAHLKGIVPLASPYVQQFAPTGETAIDRLRLAILQATLALFPATGIVLHHTDWAKIEMTKDGQGRYIVGDPIGQVAPRLWGLPVNAGFSMAVNNFLVGSFAVGAQIFDRMDVEVLLSTEDQDNFVRNMITLRAEERTCLVVKRPSAFVTGTLP